VDVASEEDASTAESLQFQVQREKRQKESSSLRWVIREGVTNKEDYSPDLELSGDCAVGMKGESYAISQLSCYSGCCWSDPFSD
jgi:hypothetical protein